MLIRLIIENIFSFGEQKEFNMLPNKKLKKEWHIYKNDQIDLLKTASIYGANGSGKSNLIKSLALLKILITKGKMPNELRNSHFKFFDKAINQSIAVEFIEQNTPFYYQITFTNGIIKREELYVSGLGDNDDELVFERIRHDEKSRELNFSESAGSNAEIKALMKILDGFYKNDESIIKLLAERVDHLPHIKKAFNWFQNSLFVLNPNSKPILLPHFIDVDSSLKSYFLDTVKALNMGIEDLKVEKYSLEEFYGADSDTIDKVRETLLNEPSRVLELKRNNKQKERLVAINEDDTVWIKQLKVIHKNHNDKLEVFDPSEESDGTDRLMDIIPIFQNLNNSRSVIIIDEIERSIHPLLIKKMISNFVNDKESLGQLIFSTHETHLLDQEVFRKDEIWFTEKDMTGSTDLYSLNKFKDLHNTKSIQRGYLDGRYGAIPFLANLNDLNWEKDDQ